MTDFAISPNHRILIIDDNPAIHADFRKILCPTEIGQREIKGMEAVLFGAREAESEPIKFELASAFQGQEGLAMVQQSVATNRPYALAFVDVRMPPGWDGVETIARILEASPQLQIVVCSAYSDYSWEELRRKIGQPDNVLVLKKPFDEVEVQQLAHALTQKWLLGRQAQLQMAALEAAVEQRTAELLQANALLAATEERFSKAFHVNPIPSGIQTLPERRFVDVNDRFVELTGSSRGELVGSVSSEILRWEQPELVEQWFAQLSRNEEVREASTKIRYRSGAVREVLVSLVTLSLGGQPHVLLQVQDVSGRLLLERQLIQAQKMEAVGQLAAGVAHDFNNILAATLMELDLLLMEPDLKPEVRNALGNLQRDNERAASLTRQLLMYSRRQAMQVKSLDLNGVLSEGIKMLRRLLGEHIVLRVQATSKEMWIEADAGMMLQLIMNLCINARDAMPKGGILTVGIKELTLNPQDLQDNREARAGNFVVLTVADNGTGMSVETVNRIFEPFFTTKEVGKGSGLGLATAYGIVKQHQGWIEVTSQVGEGSEFRVWLPAGSRATMAAATAPPMEIIPGTGTILLVEDEEPVRTMMRKSLVQANYRVFIAASGQEALAQWRDKLDQIDLLLTDMVMPGGMTGLELAEACRKLAPRLRVIITSGYSEEILQSGVPTEKGFVYLPKPCGARVLVATVRKLLAGV